MQTPEERPSIRRLIIEAAPDGDGGWVDYVTFTGDGGGGRMVAESSDRSHATWQLAMERGAWVAATVAGAAPRMRGDGPAGARWTLTGDNGGVTTDEWR